MQISDPGGGIRIKIVIDHTFGQQRLTFIATLAYLIQQNRVISTFLDSGPNEMEKRQAMLAAIIDNSEDAIISKTLEGYITSWNRAAERMFGYKEEEVIGKHISLLIPFDRLSEEDMIIENIRNGRHVEHFQTIRRTKGGNTLPISLSVSPIKDKEGRIIGASKIARDITQQIRLEQESKKNLQELELLLSIGKTFFEKLDLQTLLQRVTDITTELTGAEFGAFFYNNIDASGESYPLYSLSGVSRSAFTNFPMPRNTPLFKLTFSGEGIYRSDDITSDPLYGRNSPLEGMLPGHLSVVSYLAVPVVSPAGPSIGGLFFGHSQRAMFKADHERTLAGIANLAAIAVDNAKLYEEIKLLNQRKDEFIGIAGHELRTPITTIKGYLQLLENEMPEGQPKNFIEKALRQVNKLNSLIDDLLDVTRIQSGQLAYNLTLTPLLPLVREAVETVRQIYHTHSIETIFSGEEIIVQADHTKIEQVLVNLLGNAVKYSPNAQKIILEVKKDGDSATISVRDFGIGISKEHLPHVFHRYYRASANPVISGLGIGLYISKEIILRHKGDIWATSTPGEGSTFCFSLPIAR